jgi:hypothetical protein
MTYDSEEIRRAREEGWFHQNEKKLIEAARQKRLDAQRAAQTKEAEDRRLVHWHKCPKCGSDMRTETIEGIEIEKCTGCEGIFFDRGEIEELLVKHDEHRRGFFRKLLGFHKE